MEKKKMLMIGPGHGHNILPIIEEFNKQQFFEVDFLCYTLGFRQENYKNVRFIPIPKVRRTDLKSCVKYIFFHLKHSVFGKKYDVLLIQGETGFSLLFLLRFIKAKIKIFAPWSNGIIDMALMNTKEGFISRCIFKKSDYIFADWVTLKERIENIFPQCKIFIYNWGLHESFFTPLNNEIESDFVKEFLYQIPDYQTMVLWPRSIITANRQDLVVEALALIKKDTPEILENFTVYLWTGNVEDKIYREKIEKSILNYDLLKNIRIIDHPFVPFNDIRVIENRSDFFIQISEHDVLSTFILEMLLQEKDIILSNIPSYKYLNDFFDLKLDLVNKDIELIALAIKNKLLNINNQDIDILEYRKKVVENNFRFSKNYLESIKFMYSLSK